ncbi:hypothetical protein F5884DRAFT_899829 [Xylogone sp. PMI_703]|nr:hypothetical protein F5884DRAFT_899829 [Xylogone sp. PMI_703]
MSSRRERMRLNSIPAIENQSRRTQMALKESATNSGLRASLNLDNNTIHTNNMIKSSTSLHTKSFDNYKVMNPSQPITMEDPMHDNSTSQRKKQTQVQRTSMSPRLGIVEADCLHRQNLTDSEYHGPRSFLSICSKPGISWVLEQTGASSYREYAETLLADVTKLLKFNKSTRIRAAEPDEATARKWCKAYFEEAYGTWFGIVDPEEFEEQINDHFETFNRDRSAPQTSFLLQDEDHHQQTEHPSQQSDQENSAWYALRNAVFAAGSRVVLAKTAGYQTAHEVSCGYLGNCLATFADLLYTQTGLMGIQALALMMYFVQGLGCPSVDYMLCSAAASFCQSKGLHRKASTCSGLTESQIAHQSWIFWAVYCCEKQAAAFDDENISCEVPQIPPPGPDGNIKFCTIAISHARILSMALKKLSIPRIFHRSTDAIIRAVNELHAEAQDLLESTPTEYIPTPVSRGTQHAEKPIDVLYTQMNYWGLLCHIHSVFLYPWINDTIVSMSVGVGTDTGGSIENTQSERNAKEEMKQRLKDQVMASSLALAETSRNIILATEYIHLDATSCKDPALFFPFLAVNNIFLHILKFPKLNTVRSDISLLEVAAGHFRWVECATNSRCMFPFMKELPNWARMAVMNATIAKELQLAGSQYINSTKPTTSRNGVEGMSENESNTAYSTVDLINNDSTIVVSDTHQSLQSTASVNYIMDMRDDLWLNFVSTGLQEPQNIEGIDVDAISFGEEDLGMFWPLLLQDGNYS